MDSTTARVTANISTDWAPNEFQAMSETQANDDQNFGAITVQSNFRNFVQCDGSGCYTNGSWCLTAGNLPFPCGGPTAPWLDLTITGSPAWAVYDSACQV
jgi:hypothetical protein